jgi:hypothetical protein
MLLSDVQICCVAARLGGKYAIFAVLGRFSRHSALHFSI